MIVLVRETQGDTLLGALDAKNATFQTSYPMAHTYVGVYVNGRLKVADAADGYEIVDARTVRLRVVPRPGDTIEVEYQLQSATGGGAPGGVPRAVQAQIVAPTIRSAAELGAPQLAIHPWRPSAGGAQSESRPPALFLRDLRP